MTILPELQNMAEAYEWAATEAAKRGDFHRAAREQDHAQGVRIAMDLIVLRASESCQTCISGDESKSHNAPLPGQGG